MSDADDALTTQRCAEDALQYWDLDVADLRFVVARENAVFKVTCRDGTLFAVRIHRQGYHSLAELESENEWTTALNAAGIDTPRPVATRMGTAYATVPFGTAGDTRQVGLIEWIDGQPLDATLSSGSADPLSLYCDLGALMARMHEQAIAWRPSPGFVRHALDAEGLIGDAPWWGPFWDLPEMTDADKTVIRAARNRMYQSLLDYGKERGTYSLIHADLLPQNVLVYQGRPFVIDFDDAGYGWHQYDMAVALVTLAERDDFGDYRDALLRGYRTVRPFSDDDLALLPMFLTIRELVQIGWLHTRVGIELVLSSGVRLARHQVLEPNIRRAVRRCQELLDR
jgi:Ser/Thr protein kinase RdoA (MazF antagonist)